MDISPPPRGTRKKKITPLEFNSSPLENGDPLTFQGRTVKLQGGTKVIQPNSSPKPWTSPLQPLTSGHVFTHRSKKGHKRRIARVRSLFSMKTHVILPMFSLF